MTSLSPRRATNYPNPIVSIPRTPSHFDLYLIAMREVGADTAPITEFLKIIETRGLDAALEAPMVSDASRAFMKDTFALLHEGKPHKIAAAFSFGRENVIPGMFNSLLAKLVIGDDKAPIFHYYLRRHAELDGDEHGPAALRLVDMLCDHDSIKLEEAVNKTDLPEKICLHCHRPFSWRKKWERDWDSITCCSEACKGELKRTRYARRNES